jgi:hypothetical protein
MDGNTTVPCVKRKRSHSFSIDNLLNDDVPGKGFFLNICLLCSSSYIIKYHILRAAVSVMGIGLIHLLVVYLYIDAITGES